MSDATQLKALKTLPTDEFNNWRKSVSATKLDLEGADLSSLNLAEIDLSNASLSNADFSGTDLTGANLQQSDLSRAKFNKSILKDIKADYVEGSVPTRFLNASFVCSNLSGSSFFGAQFDKATFKNCDCSHTDFSKANLNNTTFRTCNITAAKFSKANLESAKIMEFSLETVADFSGASMPKLYVGGCTFKNSDFSNCQFSRPGNGVNFSDTKFIDCKFIGTIFSHVIAHDTEFSGSNFFHANLSSGEYSDCDFAKVNFEECLLEGPEFKRALNLHKSKNLELAKVRTDVQYLDTVVLSPREKYVNWERLRTYGRLPLFGVSYLLLLAIPFFYYILDFYNIQIEKLKDWASSSVSDQGTFANFVGEHLSIQPIPAASFYIWCATVLLAGASTIYAFGCPSRVKEFSLDEWRDQLGQPSILYLPLSWKRPLLRMLCGGLYFFGGLLALVIIVIKMLQVLAFIVRNAPSPFSLL